MLLRVCLVLAVSLAAAAKEAEQTGAERMAVEIDAAGEQSGMPNDRSAEEQAAKAGLAQQYSDALVDIMAVLIHGSESSKGGAIERLVELAMDSGGTGAEQARMFRSAVVAGGALPVLIEEAQSGADVQRKYLAATALHALALDDPTTDLDNFHSVEICQHGAVASDPRPGSNPSPEPAPTPNPALTMTILPTRCPCWWRCSAPRKSSCRRRRRGR